jgi:transcriptional regulator with XRE-family HTH domain
MRTGRVDKSDSNVDRAVGQRIRMLRLHRGLSQTDLADTIGVAFQQVQKYEKGSNRVSASRLQQFADALGVKPSFFFGEASDKPDSATRAAEDDTLGLLSDRGTVELVRAYRALSLAQQTALRHLAVTLVAAAAPEPQPL